VHQLSDIDVELRLLLGAPDGDVEPLDGGITNRNFLASYGGVRYVVRRPGKDTGLLGIDRGAELQAARAAAALGIAPEVLGTAGGCLVTRFVPSRALAGGELGASVDQLAGELRAFHACGVQLPRRFFVPDLLEDYARVVVAAGGRVADDYQAARAAVARIAAALALQDPVPCHNDLLPGNIIVTESGALMIVDWEYAGMGDSRFDLGNLAVNNGLDADAEMRLLTAYDGRPPDERRLAELALMKIVSDAREGAWAAVQGHVSELDFDFAAYGRQHFERLAEATSRPQFAGWLQLAAGV